MRYLRWAKTHQRPRYDLSGSGVPPVRPEDVGDTALSVNLEQEEPYGNLGLRQSVATLYGWCPEGVVPVPGTSSANFIALATCVKRGEGVLVEDPGYDPIRRVAEFLGLEIMPLPRLADKAFDLDFAQLESGLRAGARAAIISNLHNPSGRLLSRDRVARAANLCARFDAMLIVDEVYLDATAIIGGNSRWSAGSLRDNVLATGSLTKIYGLGSIRLGWILLPPDWVERARYVMDLLSVENAAPSCRLALHAFERIEHLEARYRRFQTQGRAVLDGWLEKEARVKVYQDYGALFALVRLPSGLDADRFVDLLTADFETQVVPGRFFGLTDHVRLSLGVPPDELAKALKRVSAALDHARRSGWIS